MAAVATATPTNLPGDAQVPLDSIPISPSQGSPEVSASNDDGLVTVFHDKDNFNVKHPLMHEWTLWFTKPPSGKVGDFRTNGGGGFGY